MEPAEKILGRSLQLIERFPVQLISYGWGFSIVGNTVVSVHKESTEPTDLDPIRACPLGLSALGREINGKRFERVAKLYIVSTVLRLDVHWLDGFVGGFMRCVTPLDVGKDGFQEGCIAGRWVRSELENLGLSIQDEPPTDQ